MNCSFWSGITALSTVLTVMRRKVFPWLTATVHSLFSWSWPCSEEPYSTSWMASWSSSSWQKGRPSPMICWRQRTERHRWTLKWRKLVSHWCHSCEELRVCPHQSYLLKEATQWAHTNLVWECMYSCVSRYSVCWTCRYMHTVIQEINATVLQY